MLIGLTLSHNVAVSFEHFKIAYKNKKKSRNLSPFFFFLQFLFKNDHPPATTWVVSSSVFSNISVPDLNSRFGYYFSIYFGGGIDKDINLFLLS